MRSITLGFLLLATTCAASARTRELPVWTPQTAWTLEATERDCAANRTYVRGKQKLTIGIQLYAASDSAAIRFVPRDERVRFDRVRVATGDVDVDAQGSAWQRRTAQNLPVYAIHLKGPEFARLLSTRRLEVDAARLDAVLDIGDFSATLESLDQCNAALLQKWGFSPETSRLSSYVEPLRPMESYFSAGDYPADALREGARGLIRAMVTVGLDGRARDCRLLTSAGNASLDKATCRIMVERAAYAPARTQKGEPIEAPYIAQVYWRLTW